MPSAERVPVTVLTGFLGSGKTTLLNALLRAPHGRKIAVIVNEIGAVGIDGKVVQGGEAFVELDNGCLCCVLNADLATVLQELKARGGFDHLVLETTGLADPLPIGWMFSRPGLSDFYRLDAIVTVVDAKNMARVLAEAPEASQQLTRADVVVLTKLDLLADGGAAARAAVREMNELAPIIEAEHGVIPFELVLSPEVQGRQRLHAPQREHVPSLQSWVFESARPTTEGRLEELLAAMPSEVYRIKGLVATELGWLLVNVVAGRLDMLPVTPRVEPGASALVFLGRDLDTTALQERCSAAFA